MKKIMNKKNIITLGASAAAVGVLGIGAFAFFSDHTEQDKSGTVGTVDIVDNGNLTIQNENNMNPGDEDPKNPPIDPDKPGSHTTSHELTFGIKNEGTKSVITRNIVDIEVTALYMPNEDGTIKREGDVADGPFVKVPEGQTVYLNPSYFHLYQNGTRDELHNYVENVEVTDAVTNASRFLIEKTDKDGNKYSALRYIIPGAVLDGKGSDLAQGGNAEKDSTTVDSDSMDISDDKNSVAYTYYLGLESTMPDCYQGAGVKVDVEVQAMQYRNTNNGTNTEGNMGDWQTVFKDSVSTGNKGGDTSATEGSANGTLH